jgi:hypothetical protein
MKYRTKNESMRTLNIRGILQGKHLARKTIEHLGNFVLLRIVRRLLVKAKVVPSSPILATLKMVALCSTETSVPTRATRRNTPEGAILPSHRRENLKSYTINLSHFRTPHLASTSFD